MPPRHAYWTILVDEQPTAFRAALLEDLQPTFKRLKEKHPSARVVWFQNGKVWTSREDAQAAMRARGEMGRRGDVRQRFGDRTRDPRPEQADRRNATGKLEWKPKGAPGTALRPQDPRTPGPRARPSAKREGKLEWKPKGSFAPAEGRPAKKEWRSKGPRTARPRTGDKLEWRPKSQAAETRAPEKRKWVPKEEYKKSQSARPQARDSKWRPGGEHRDPRQKYKDAKKAKWSRFKQTVRKRWEAKQPRKKKDDE
jgi:hypothetical protein